MRGNRAHILTEANETWLREMTATAARRRRETGDHTQHRGDVRAKLAERQREQWQARKQYATPAGRRATRSEFGRLILPGLASVRHQISHGRPGSAHGTAPRSRTGSGSLMYGTRRRCDCSANKSSPRSADLVPNLAVPNTPPAGTASARSRQSSDQVMGCVHDSARGRKVEVIFVQAVGDVGRRRGDLDQVSTAPRPTQRHRRLVDSRFTSIGTYGSPRATLSRRRRQLDDWGTSRPTRQCDTCHAHDG